MGMNVLSIDYDFFVNVSSAIATVYYPDGIDVRNKSINEIIWSTHYDYLPSLYDLNINKNYIKQIKKILLNQNKNIPVKICESHVEAYDFIFEQWDYNEDVNIFNIDFHHDLFNKNNFLDCGNWIGNVKEQVLQEGAKFSLKWITRLEGLKCYGFTHEELKDLKTKANIYTDMDCISDQTFDILFLCRSDPWTPPHLDKHFTDLVNFIYENFNFVSIEDDVLEERKILELIPYRSELFKDIMGEKNGRKHKKTKDSGTR